MATCKTCSNDFTPTRNSKGWFCSRSCANVFNKTRLPRGACAECGKTLTWRTTKFCSRVCAGNSRKKNGIQRWLNGEVSGCGKDGVLLQSIRNYLIELNNSRCSECGWGVPNPVTGKPILTVDHIDGNWKNNRPENLKILCYNCHTLTPTFGTLNSNGQFAERPGTFRKSDVV